MILLHLQIIRKFTVEEYLVKEYKTSQRKRLYEFLAQNRNRQLTVEDISRCLTGISISAVYRNINQLVAEGSVKRFHSDGSRKLLYQYFGTGDCAEHLHLKCDKCGTILHMNNDAFKNFVTVLEKVGNFNLDKKKSLLVGHCKSCG